MVNTSIDLLNPPKIVILKKALPNCPVGRLFKLTNDGNHYYHSISDSEAIYSNLKPYIFSVNEVVKNSEFFALNVESLF